jgi:hypothetical protein
VLHGCVWYHADLCIVRSEVFVSDIDPADATLTGRRAAPEGLPPDLVEPPAAPRKAEREGLPPGYRMRADAHYVDQLTSRRGQGDARRDVDTHDLEAPVERRDARDRRGDRALVQLAEDLATIDSAAGLLGDDASALGRRVSLDLIRAHVWRAAWVIKAQALVDGPARGIFRTRPILGILQRVVDGFAAECRLNGATIEIDAADGRASAALDDSGLLTGLAGGIIATLGLVGPAEGATLRLSLVTSGDAPGVEIAQDAVPVRSGVAQRFLDPAWIDRPGGWTAALGAAAARTAAHQHGGTAAFVLGDVRGSVLRLTLGRG